MDLGSLNLDNLENIINSLSQSDIEQLSNMAETFLGGDNKQEGGQTKHNREEKEDIPFNFDPQTIAKIMKIMNKLSSRPQDPRCDLLTALKPMLSKDRQKKADEAINMLRILSLLPMLGELGI